MKRIYLLFLFFISLSFVSCYEDPFFKLKVFVVDQDFLPVEGADVIISVQNDLGEIIEDATVFKSASTDNNGLASFDFENLGFIAKDPATCQFYNVLLKAGVRILEKAEAKMLAATARISPDLARPLLPTPSESLESKAVWGIYETQMV